MKEIAIKTLSSQMQFMTVITVVVLSSRAELDDDVDDNVTSFSGLDVAKINELMFSSSQSASNSECVRLGHCRWIQVVQSLPSIG